MVIRKEKKKKEASAEKPPSKPKAHLAGPNTMTYN